MWVDWGHMYRWPGAGVSRRHHWTNLTKKQELLDRITLIQHNPGCPNLQIEEWICQTHLRCWRAWARGECRNPKTTENESRVWRAQRLPSRPWELGWHRCDSPPALSPEQLRVRSRLPTSVASSVPPGLPSSAFLDSCGKKRHVLIVRNTRRMLECVLISPNL